MSSEHGNGPSFPRFFNPEELGKSLKEVAADLIAAGDQRVVSRWFHSAKDADLFIWQDTKNNVLKQQISFYGQVVEWNILEGVKTGFIMQIEGENGRPRPTEIIRFDSKAQPAQVQQAVTLLRHITGLDASERDALSTNFTDSGSVRNMDPEEFVRRFGSFLETAPKPSAAPRAGVWAWIRSFFRKSS